MKSEDVTQKNYRAPHRALFKAMGITDKQLEKPLIGVAAISNEVIPGHYHIEQIVKAVRDGILLNGGTPISFSTIGVCDGIAMNHEGMKYSLPSRELIADSIEVMAAAHALDALVLIPNCDKSIPGMIMGAARLDIPFMVLTGGPMLAGRLNGKRIDLGSVFEGVAAYKSGSITEEELSGLENYSCPGAGCCSGMYTANSLGCVCEALGLSLPFSGTAMATSGERLRIAKETGCQIVEMVKSDVKMSNLITIKSFYNAITVDVALGCSTNSLLHIPAVANSFGYKIDFNDLNRISDKTPQIGSFRPGGTNYVEDLHYAGGIPAVMGELKKKGLLCDDQRLGNGKRIKDIDFSGCNKNTDIIRDINNPYQEFGGLAVLYGNLSPNGSVIKRSAVDKTMYKFSGRARVFECEEDAYEAIVNRRILKGEVIVIRNEGPKGGPGMREMLAPTQALVGTKMDKDVYIITDGRFSGASSGPAIGYVSPEAYDGGLIGILQNGDIISIDLNKKMLNVELTELEIKQRFKEKKEFVKKVNSPFLQRYRENVTSAERGAVFLEEE